MHLINLELGSVFKFKYVFNPSIARQDDGLLLICRLQNHEHEGFLGICELDKEYKPTGKYTILQSSPLAKSQAMLEDPRIFTYGARTYIGYVEASQTSYYLIYTVFAELKNNEIINPVLIDYKKNLPAYKRTIAEQQNPNRKLLPHNEWLVEKNWQFFIKDDRYFCIYQAGKEHEVFEFDPSNGTPLKRYITYYRPQWPFGRISGGASPVLMDDGKYYSFFHSWTEWTSPSEKRDWEQRKYHIGVYVFEDQEPFRITKISSKPIFSAQDDGELAPPGHIVVFPGSAIFDAQKKQWLLAIGWNDLSSKMLIVNHSEVVDSLVEVKQVSPAAFIYSKYQSLVCKITRKIVKKLTA